MTMTVGFTRSRLGVDACHHAGKSMLAPVGGGPIDDDDEAIAKADQEVDVREQPEEPREETAELEVAHWRNEIDDGRVATDGGQRAVIAITKRQCRLSGD